jgi:hypothetical protein
MQRLRAQLFDLLDKNPDDLQAAIKEFLKNITHTTGVCTIYFDPNREVFGSDRFVSDSAFRKGALVLVKRQASENADETATSVNEAILATLCDAQSRIFDE